ncbi:MAG: hypothetical protein KDC57_16010 [Saprospiraceae bacterium]|nr:hypothetical protein [Saprospiraceae bacterium]
MRMHKVIFVWLLLLVVCPGLVAQDQAADIWNRLVRYLNQEFPGHQWDSQQGYAGRLQDGIPFLLWLATDGEEVAAVYQFALQESYFWLEGDVKGQNLTLAEWNEDHRPSGQWQLKRQGASWEGLWYNTDRDRQLVVNMQPTSQTTDWETVTPTSWIRSYQGQYNGNDYDLTLVKDLWRIHGILYNRNTKHMYFLTGSCDYNQSTKFNLEAFDDRNLKKADAGLQITQPAFVQMSWQPVASAVSYFELSLRRELPVQVDLTADETSMYNLSFPDVTDFNLRKKIMRYIGDVRDEFARLEREVGDPTDRWKHTLHVWPEVSWYNGRFFSGMLIAKSDQGQYEMLELNYDFDKEELIDLTTLFKKKFDYRAAIEAYLAPQLQLMDWPFELEYMRPQLKDFKYVNLTKRGFRVLTGFSPLYGQKSFIIPYAYFEGNLDNNTIIDYLIKYQ